MALSGLLLAAGLTLMGPSVALAQSDPVQDLNQTLREATRDQFGFTFEERTRWEEKDGVNFGKSVDQQDMLSRLRIGADFTPILVVHDQCDGPGSRAPFYGAGAPNTMRDTMDLQEGYIELFRPTQTGFGAIFGRQMLNYGESRLIGSRNGATSPAPSIPGASITVPTRMHFEVLMVSPVKVLAGRIQCAGSRREDLGHLRYVFQDLAWRFDRRIRAAALAEQNRRLDGCRAHWARTPSAAGFMARCPGKFGYDLEGIGQTGHMGLLRAASLRVFLPALPASTTVLGQTAGFLGEYKVRLRHRVPDGQTAARLTSYRPPIMTNSGRKICSAGATFVRLKSLETLSIAKSFAGERDVYRRMAGQPPPMRSTTVRAPPSLIRKSGTAGTKVGQELDRFVTYKYGAHLFGAGVGHFFKGEFVTETTKDINPRYFYFFQQYSFK